MAAAALHGELRRSSRMSPNKLLRHQICHRGTPPSPVLLQRKAYQRVIQLRTTTIFQRG
uniref:Uncharacterized protein n=1 Tax=Arundo donax TaxID=35708 RepID=A0A0A9A2S7_ARUDO